MNPSRNDLAIHAIYGIGGAVTISVPRESLRGRSVREVLELVLKGPFEAGSPHDRTALIITEAIHSRRKLDIEVCHSADTAGTPVALDDVVDGMISGDHQEDTEGTAMESELHFRITEPYRGGRR